MLVPAGGVRVLGGVGGGRESLVDGNIGLRGSVAEGGEREVNVSIWKPEGRAAGQLRGETARGAEMIGRVDANQRCNNVLGFVFMRRS